MIDPLAGSKNLEAPFNQGSAPRYLHRDTSSSITSTKEWSCTQAIKNIFSRLYDFLARWISFLPKREQTFKRWVEGIRTIEKNPEYQKNPEGYIVNLLKINGHYRYNTGDPILTHFLQLHRLISPVDDDGHETFGNKYAKQIDNEMQRIKLDLEYQKNPKEYLKREFAGFRRSVTFTEKDQFILCALWDLECYKKI